MTKTICWVIVAFLLAIGSASADTLYGTVKFKDGSKDIGTTSISQSYNSKKAKLDKNGKYKLDFGTKVGSKVTVYVNGTKYTTITVDGDTELNITIP